MAQRVASIDINPLQMPRRPSRHDDGPIELGAELFPVVYPHADVMEAQQVLIRHSLAVCTIQVLFQEERKLRGHLSYSLNDHE